MRSSRSIVLEEHGPLEESDQVIVCAALINMLRAPSSAP